VKLYPALLLRILKVALEAKRLTRPNAAQHLTSIVIDFSLEE
jgi:hypothetical protein